MSQLLAVFAKKQPVIDGNNAALNLLQLRELAMRVNIVEEGWDIGRWLNEVVEVSRCDTESVGVLEGEVQGDQKVDFWWKTRERRRKPGGDHLRHG